MNCRFGDTCVRYHPVCAFYNHSGRCLKGDNCNYRHCSEEEEIARLTAARAASVPQQQGFGSPQASPTTSPVTSGSGPSATAVSGGPQSSLRMYMRFCLLQNKDLEEPRQRMHSRIFESLPKLPNGHALLHEFLLLDDEALFQILSGNTPAQTAEMQSIIDSAVAVFWEEAMSKQPDLRLTLAANLRMQAQAQAQQAKPATGAARSEQAVQLRDTVVVPGAARGSPRGMPVILESAPEWNQQKAAPVHSLAKSRPTQSRLLRFSSLAA
eukprot:TRINITY_DN237_c0_g1_i3.p1 TRINITY_DN237_c0_g1~~TRINITY_DN237_c0_g1_i3.p1  ORF type:complete len:315 (-),score=72.99 TRINITY_DN237_c0_g1_i3:104-907(-)